MMGRNARFGLRLGILLLAILAVAVGVVLWRKQVRSKAEAPLVHQAYLWQRVWTPEVLESLNRAPEILDGLLVLAGQVSWEEGELVEAPFKVDFSPLSGLGFPVGLTFRVGGFPGRFEHSPEAVEQLEGWMRAAVARAGEAGIEPSEVQVDFDCPESKLADYAYLIGRLGDSFAGLPITLTALPAWLDREEFRQLAETSSGYVLQVHSLSPPRRIEERMVLFDPEASRSWMRQAENVGVPFRIALPTYGYRVLFDSEGGYRRIAAETGTPEIPEGWSLREVRTDPAEVARFVREIENHRSSLLSGLVWFRLPVDQDALNWRWRTFVSVVQGNPAEAALEPILEWEEPGLLRVAIANRGAGDFAGPISLHVSWEDSGLVAADGLSGFQTDSLGEAALRFERPAPGDSRFPGNSVIPPAFRVEVGWLRFGATEELKVAAHLEE
jgi:hypothetical protein